ncbi:hypothetical protein COBT_002037 [Conglomerata obtusa]
MSFNEEKIKKFVSSIEPTLEIPLPIPTLIQQSLVFNQERTFSNEVPIEKRIITPQNQYIALDLVSIVHSELQEAAKEPKNIVKVKKSIKTKDDEPEVSYGDIVKESFNYIDDDFIFDDIENIYELFPDKILPTDFLCVNLNDDDFRMDVKEKYEKKDMPKSVIVNGNQYSCMPVDMSEYVYIKLEGDKAYYREIGANLNLKKK